MSSGDVKYRKTMGFFLFPGCPLLEKQENAWHVCGAEKPDSVTFLAFPLPEYA